MVRKLGQVKSEPVEMKYNNAELESVTNQFADKHLHMYMYHESIKRTPPPIYGDNADKN